MATATKNRAKINLKPISDRVLIRRDESDERTAGGIVLPDTAKDKPTRGTVVALGDGRLLENGTRSTFLVKVGDRVIFNSYGIDTYHFEDEELLLARESEILAIIE
jgi:chaperonin GroES